MSCQLSVEKYNFVLFSFNSFKIYFSTYKLKLIKNILDNFDYKKYKINISGSSKKEIIVSFIQDCLRINSKTNFQPIDLNIYLFDSKAEVI